MSWIKDLMFRWYLFYKGIRFYKTESIPKSPEFRKAVFQTVGDHKIQFFFYREICEDLIFKRGRIKKETWIGYLIQTKIDDNLPECLRRYNNLKFFFNSRNWVVSDQEKTTDTLLRIYLDFLKTELESNRSLSGETCKDCPDH